jgi:hypothetical protein
VEKWMDWSTMTNDSLLEDELRNWSRWACIGSDPTPSWANHCYSIESRYVPRAGSTWGDDDKPSAPIDHESARVIDEIFHRLPVDQRLALCVFYPNRWLWMVDDDEKNSHHDIAARAAKSFQMTVKALYEGLDDARKRLMRELYEECC